MKRTLERELKVPEIAKREANGTSASGWDWPRIKWKNRTARAGMIWTSWLFLGLMSQRKLGADVWALLIVGFLLDFVNGGCGVRPDLGLRPFLNVAYLRQHLRGPSGASGLAVVRCNTNGSWRWRNGSILPVLKHGPRSRTHTRVCGCQTCMRNESNSWNFFVLPQRPSFIHG